VPAIQAPSKNGNLTRLRRGAFNEKSIVLTLIQISDTLPQMQ
jgi:hypothetical protein